MNPLNFPKKELVEHLKGEVKQCNKAIHWIYNNELYRRKIFGFIRSSGGAEDAAEEIFQDGILNLVKSVRAGNYKMEYPLENYLFGICRYLWFKWLRRNSKYKTGELPEQYNPVDQNTPEILLLEKEKRETVAELMDKLGEPCKTILELWSAGHSAEEIAAAMSYSTDYARLRVYRCKRKVEELLDNDPNLFNRLKD